MSELSIEITGVDRDLLQGGSPIVGQFEKRRPLVIGIGQVPHQTS
jgi:hypothetical protein